MVPVPVAVSVSVVWLSMISLAVVLTGGAGSVQVVTAMAVRDDAAQVLSCA